MQTNTKSAEPRMEDSPLLVVKSDGDGFQVYNPNEPNRVYQVTGSSQEPQCTCPEFRWRKPGEPERICVHIEAIMSQLREKMAPPDSARSRFEAVSGNGAHSTPEPQVVGENCVEHLGPAATMTLKRSVSADGRINSFSVELTLPVSGLVRHEVFNCARKGLKCQEEIVSSFLDDTIPETGGQDNDDSCAGRDSPVPATLRDIGGMQTRFGWRFFINVEAGGETYKLIGDRKKLGQQLTNAGHARLGHQITEGKRLNVPCLAVIEDSADGRYTNVVELLPSRAQDSRGR